MISRERVLKALDHKETDKIPLDLGSTESSGITWKPYYQFKKHYGVISDIDIFDMSQLICKVDLKILEYIGADAIPLIIEPRNWKTWQFEKDIDVKIPDKVVLKKLDNGDIIQMDSGGRIAIARLASKGNYFDTIYHPLADLKNISDLISARKWFESFDLPYYCDESLDELKTRAQKLHDETGYAVVGNLWVHVLAAGQQLRGFEQFMCDLISNKPLAKGILTEQMESYFPRVEKYIDSVGKYLDVIQVNDDLGTQNGPQLAPDLYREMIKPFHKKLWGYIKQKSNKPLLLHSCGSIYKLLPDIIDCGIDAINPVQVTARDMDTHRLKREFGKHLTFWGGGCDSQKILPFGSSEDVRHEVKKRVDDLRVGGGFVFCQVHNIQPDVPLENILAMYDELRIINGESFN